MTIKVGNQYIHTVLGYVDDTGTTVITEDPELATMTGKYSDTSAVESSDPAAYAWEAIDLTEPDEETDEDESETGESDNDLLFRLAATQSAESVQENLVTGTNQGADGWQAGAGTLEDAACSPEENGTTGNGVRWTAAANDTLSRTADIAGEAVPESVTVSFWWNASAQCGLTASIGENSSEKQCNYDSADLDEDGNALDLSGAWLFFEALVPIGTTADSYPVKITADSAATIDLCDFKVEPGDKTTQWTTSPKEAMILAQDAQMIADGAVLAAGNAQSTADSAASAASKAQSTADNEVTNRTAIIRAYNGGVLVAKTGQTIGALVNADGSFDVVGVSWNGNTPTVTSKLYARYGAETTILNGNGDYIKLSDGSVEVSGTIKGATLEGAKLTGESIDIESSDESGTTSIRTYLNSEGHRTVEIYDSGGSAGLKSYIIISNGTIRIAGQSLEIDTDNLVSTANFIDSKETYTTFDSDLISSGSVRVTRLLGKLCLLEGNLTLSGVASSTTVILDATKVPANAAGTKYINLSNSQNSSFTRPLAFRTNASGGLAIRYGAAGRYDFSWLYVTS